MSCCNHPTPPPPKPAAGGCCPQPDHEHGKKRIDWLLYVSATIIVTAYVAWLLAGEDLSTPWMHHFSHAAFELVNAMWWGVVAGIFFVGVMGKIPREFIMRLLGRGGSLSGILRACMGGVLMDLCSHGILLVGMKLYERGASLGQVMAFLIASPWNSFSLTLILIALVGLKWTLLFIVLSMVIAIVSGVIFELLVKKQILPANPNQADVPEDFRFIPEAKRQLRSVQWRPALFADMMRSGLADSAMVLRWVFFGVVLAASIRAFVPAEQFAAYFGATTAGLWLTIVAATLIEVCSEGSTPIAADLLTRADAPGNSFAFLMTGVSTDYTEIMVLRETTRSWKVALFLPLVTLPQVVAIAWIINNLA